MLAVIEFAVLCFILCATLYVIKLIFKNKDGNK